MNSSGSGDDEELVTSVWTWVRLVISQEEVKKQENGRLRREEDRRKLQSEVGVLNRLTT